MENSEVRTVYVRGNGKALAQQIQIAPHCIVSDEPLSAGGTDSGPNPYDLLLGALGACTSMTMTLYAHRKAWPLEDVIVHLRHSKVHAADCADCERKDVTLDQIEREIHLSGNLSGEQRARLLDIANKCPVHKALSSGIHIETRLV
jgi:putative redox protein